MDEEPVDFSSSDLLGGDLKDILWDDNHIDFKYLAGADEEFDIASLLAPVDDKKVVMAAAVAAGLHKGGLKRAAFSTGDLQALTPASPTGPMRSSPPPRFQSPSLEPVPEGAAALMTNMPQHVGVIPSYILVSTAPMGSAPASGLIPQQQPTQLASLSIEEIEEQLRRTREAAAGGASTSAAMPVAAAQTMYYTTASPIKAETFSNFRSGPIMAVSAGPPTMTIPMPETMVTSGPGANRPLARPSALRRTQSAVELRQMASADDGALGQLLKQEVEIDLNDGIYRIGKLTPEERREKILKYRQKRHERNFKKKIKYVCRKTLADSRPRVRGRFARNDDLGAKPPVVGGV